MVSFPNLINYGGCHLIEFIMINNGGHVVHRVTPSFAIITHVPIIKEFRLSVGKFDQMAPAITLGLGRIFNQLSIRNIWFSGHRANDITSNP